MSGVAYVWSVLGMLTILKGYLPPELQNYVRLWFNKLMKMWSPDPYCRFYFHELDGHRMNHLYRQVEMHLRAKQLTRQADDLYLSQDENAKRVNYSLAGNETVSEVYEGVKVWWTFHTQKSKGHNGGEREENEYVLKMLKSDKAFVMECYMDYVFKSAWEYKTQLRDLYLYSCNHDRWKTHLFAHPSTFQTLAMDPVAKERLMVDLDAYTKGAAYFNKVGRAWKRGYLLYGPPGTGKSSLIAAMANKLRYNIYDLELTEVHDNSQLKTLLTQTTSRSIIVIEDIDCSLDLTGSRVEKAKRPPNSNNSTSKVTLSGLLNFTDGLWSCLGNERIIIFTTNHIEKLDPGLLRPGRMDMHIHMSFCNFAIFKVLAQNYLGVTTDPMFEKIEQLLLEDSVRITPAEVTEFLFEHKDNSKLALERLVEELVRRTLKPLELVADDSEVPETEELVEASNEGIEEDEDGKCNRIHCNVQAHQGQTDWYKMYVGEKSRSMRQRGGGGRGRRGRSGWF